MHAYQQHLTIDHNKRFGQPVIIGTRISVYDVLSWLSEGMSAADIVNDFPELNEAQIMACLSYAADKEHKTAVCI